MEPIGRWWQRRRFSRGLDVPYPIGTYREAWSPYPVLVRQYRPEYNEGIVLSQIPPAAEVYLCWLCDAGHLFVATPEEQRHRPGRERRRSAWCPDCSALAVPRTPRPVAEPRVAPPAPPRAPANRVCPRTPSLPIGEAFASECAPPPASRAEPRLRALLSERLVFEPGLTAVRLSRPFFDHLEAWPDIVLGDLRVAVEYDSTGRHGLEHVGRREEADRRKDRALRSAGWEVIRVRTGRLLPLGPHDLTASGATAVAADGIIDALRRIRGPLLVDAWRR